MKSKTLTILHGFCMASILLATAAGHAAEPPSFNTTWIPAKPEVSTYRSSAKQGDGLYQVSLSRSQSGIEIYMNIITTGFTKSVWGSMTVDMRPRESKSRIIVQDQITMQSDCAYSPGKLRIATVMAPYSRVMDNTLSFSNLVVDFSQAPLLARTLPLKPGAQFKFDSLNPQNNSLVPLTLRVVGEETLQKVACYKVEGTDYEGSATYWVEKADHHRVLRIEQPATGRVTELML